MNLWLTLLLAVVQSLVSVLWPMFSFIYSALVGFSFVCSTLGGFGFALVGFGFVCSAWWASALLFRPGGLRLHLLHPRWILLYFSSMDNHCMDRALHPSWFLVCSASGASGAAPSRGGYCHSHQLNCTAFPSIPLATHLHSVIITHT